MCIRDSFICHEIAHMWFGDLVTMKWWNGIWLNEAFATFMATRAVADYNSDWNRWAQFSLEKSMAMDIDSLTTTRAIEYPVISPSDADGMFDLITYEKGGSILRMLEQFLGEDIFREGVSRYLTIHSFSNTETDDLWNSLEVVSKLPVKRMMDTWIFQPGHPVISYNLNGEKLSLIKKISHPLMSNLLEYVLNTPGKRVRPAITLLAANFNSHDYKIIDIMATAVEMLHIATLIHDDTVDDSKLRRGKKTVSNVCLLYTSPSPRDGLLSRMPSSA